MRLVRLLPLLVLALAVVSLAVACGSKGGGY